MWVFLVPSCEPRVHCSGGVPSIWPKPRKSEWLLFAGSRLWRGLFQSPSPTRPRFELPWRPPASSSSTKTVAVLVYAFGSRQSRGGENRRELFETPTAGGGGRKTGWVQTGRTFGRSTSQVTHERRGYEGIVDLRNITVFRSGHCAGPQLVLHKLWCRLLYVPTPVSQNWAWIYRVRATMRSANQRM